jgi:hypothetical protein
MSCIVVCLITVKARLLEQLGELDEATLDALLTDLPEQELMGFDGEEEGDDAGEDVPVGRTRGMGGKGGPREAAVREPVVKAAAARRAVCEAAVADTMPRQAVGRWTSLRPRRRGRARPRQTQRRLERTARWAGCDA